MSEEKPERRRRDEKEGEGTQEKWRRDPISGVVFGLLLALLGVTLFLAGQQRISWDDWWKYFIIGLGVIFLIEVLVRQARPAYRRPMFGRLVAGVIFICVGLAFLIGIGTWWPLILVAVGLAIVFYALLRRR
jgi:peptidoglycan/LPS O-acetylase OafA/YrhL